MADLEPLHPLVAAAADELIDAVLTAAAAQVTATGCSIDDALRAAWDAAAERMPFDWAVAVLRLRETDNAEMLRWADPDAGTDDEEDPNG